MIESNNISFIIQGVLHPEITPLAIKNIRLFFPDAEIVLGTYAGSDTAGIDCDKVAMVPDPGFYPICDAPNAKPHNINRQIQTTLAGLKAATREFAFKLRSDFILTGKGFLEFWGRFPRSDPEYRVFEEKVLSCVFFARNPRIKSQYPNAFHPSDFAFFGLRRDLINLFDIPFMTKEEAAYCQEKEYISCRYTPEQHLWVGCLRKNGKHIDFDHQRDSGREIADKTEKYLVSNFIYLDWTQFCLDPPKRLTTFADNDFFTCITHVEWQKLYKRYLDDELVLPPHDPLREFVNKRRKIFRRYEILARLIALPFRTKLLKEFRRNLRKKLIERWTKNLYLPKSIDYVFMNAGKNSFTERIR